MSSPRRVRVGVFAVVALLHILMVLGLIRAFMPDFTRQVTRQVVSAFTVTVTPPPNPAKVETAPGPAGSAAKARKAEAPRPKLAVADPSAPPAQPKGADNTSGAHDTGAGGQGSGSGNGQGAGGAAKPVKIAGEINSARDYPRESRDLRIGDHVIVALTVGTDGRVKACRVHRASRDSQADRITCELATRRFRFRPARDAGGNPVESVFGWQQRWFYPAESARKTAP